MSKGRLSRKQFLRLTVGAAVGGVVLPGFGSRPAWAVDDESPDFVVLNARVLTSDRRHRRAQAFAVKDGIFVAVGSNAQIANLAGQRTQRFDVQGMAVVPGMIDTHNHGNGVELLYDTHVGNPSTIEFFTVARIIDTLRGAAAQTPAGFWVEGTFFDDTKVTDGPLRREHLDQVSAEHPIRVRHRGGHTQWYNSKAFELAGITATTPNPPDGTFERDANGNLTGQVTERANDFFSNIAPTVPVSPEERTRRTREGYAYISQKFVEFGLTSVHMSGPNRTALQDVRESGGLRHRVYAEVSDVQAVIDAGLHTGMGDEWIRIGSRSEFSVDGSFSERTLLLTRPYRDTPPEHGVQVVASQEALDQHVEELVRHGIQVNLHVNGDAGIDMGLKAIERAQRLVPDAPHLPEYRAKLTHCTILNADLDLAGRIRALNAVPQPFTTYLYYNSDKFQFYGRELMREAMAFGTFAAAGIPAAAGSDFRPGPFDPMMAIQGMVTRTGWDGQTWGSNQRVSIDQALEVYTINGAYASYEEHIKGSITPGKLADYVVLSEDPHTVDRDKIKDIEIVRSVVGGESKFER
jgi:predicted amidohydrolase YtcJ